MLGHTKSSDGRKLFLVHKDRIDLVCLKSGRSQLANLSHKSLSSP